MTHAPTIQRLFALEHAFRPRPPLPAGLPQQILPKPGEITFITGPSGGGKSSLLQAVRSSHDGETIRWIDPSQIRLPDAPVIDCVCTAMSDSSGESPEAIEHALELLSRVGLAEAWTYLQKPTELSDGQRWRLVLALVVAAARRASETKNDSIVTAIIAMDEFAALLDRITARVVARALRRLIRPSSSVDTPRLAAIVATSHDDLTTALMPETIVRCDFDEYTVERREN